jgi:glycosyltransferase involved in cell wall biosynthesis
MNSPPCSSRKWPGTSMRDKLTLPHHNTGPEANRPLRVLFLVSGVAVEGPLGGVERHVIELACAFDPAKVTPIVGGLWRYHAPHEQKWLDMLQARGIPVFLAAEWDAQAAYRSCWRALRNLPGRVHGPIDLIHSHGTFSDLAAILLKSRIGASKLVRTVHNEFEWSKRPLYGKLFPSLIYPLCFDHELGVSRQVVENLNRRRLARGLARLAHARGRASERATVSHNAINFERFGKTPEEHAQARMRLRRELDIPPDCTVIGSIGRLTAQKGYDILLASVPAVLEARPDTHFVLVGTGADEAALRSQAQARQVAEHVHFTGARTDVEDLLTTFDLFVSPSRWEGLPTVILESIAAGIPLVATQVSGTVELVRAGVNGLLVPPEDSQALADALLDALADLPRYTRGAEIVRREIRQRFSIQSIAARHQELYARLLAQT